MFNCSFGGVLHNAFIRTFDMLSIIIFLILLKLVLVKDQVEKDILGLWFLKYYSQWITPNSLFTHFFNLEP